MKLLYTSKVEPAIATLVGLLILFVPVSIGALNPSAEISAALAAVLSLVLVSIRPSYFGQYMPRYMQIVIVLFVVYFGLGVAAYFVNPPAHNSLDSIGTTIHFLLFVPMLMVLHKYPPKVSWVWIAIILGSCLNGLHALYFNSRGTINPILFGDVSVYLAFGSLVSLSYMRRYKFGLLLSLLGFFLGLIAAFYSLSRGSWLAVGPLMLVVLYYLYKSMESKKRLVVPLVILTVLVIGSVFAGWSKIQPRIDLAFSEFDTYLQGDVYRTSVGYRLETYKGALLTIKENPVFGVGPGNRAEYFNDLESRGLLRDLDHILNAHNQIFEDGIDKGLLGIASYFALMMYLFLVFLKYKDQHQSVRVYDPLNVAGVMLIIGFAVFGLTNITFTHGTFNTFFVCMVMLLLVARTPSRL
jgi:O-antigen ligase